jgi:hypothetical protein
VARFTDPDEARTYLSGLSAHADRPGDTSSLNPEFAVKAANAISDARVAGLPVSLLSGYREGTATGSKYDMGGYSAHGYGLASDFDGIGAPGSKTAQQWNQIAQANGLHNPYLGTKAEGKEWNHWQLPTLPLEQTPDALAALRKAKATGDMSQVWAASAPFMSGGTMVASAAKPGTTINAANAPVTGALGYTGGGSGATAPAVAAINAQAKPAGGGFLNSVANIESNDRNIPSTVDKDYPGQPGSKSQGHWQIDTPTWLQFAAKTGVDTKLYPNAMSAPREVQAQVASAIPLGRFGGQTIKKLNAQYGTTLDKTQTLGALDAKYGGGSGATATADAATTAAPAATTSAPAATAAPDTWYGKLVSQPESGGKSPMEKFADAFAQGPQKMKQAEEDQAPQTVKNVTGPAPIARNVSPGLQNVAQTYGQTLNTFSQPLTWNNAPPGAPQMPPAGLQPTPGAGVPGISLNSFQPPPQGLGYGIPAVGYGYG